MKNKWYRWSSRAVQKTETLVGSYATVNEAECAMHYPPYSARQSATICDQDGYCVVR